MSDSSPIDKTAGSIVSPDPKGVTFSQLRDDDPKNTHIAVTSATAKPRPPLPHSNSLSAARNSGTVRSPSKSDIEAIRSLGLGDSIVDAGDAEPVTSASRTDGASSSKDDMPDSSPSASVALGRQQQTSGQDPKRLKERPLRFSRAARKEIERGVNHSCTDEQWIVVYGKFTQEIMNEAQVQPNGLASIEEARHRLGPEATRLCVTYHNVLTRSAMASILKADPKPLWTPPPTVVKAPATSSASFHAVARPPAPVQASAPQPVPDPVFSPLPPNRPPRSRMIKGDDSSSDDDDSDSESEDDNHYLVAPRDKIKRDQSTNLGFMRRVRAPAFSATQCKPKITEFANLSRTLLTNNRVSGVTAKNELARFLVAPDASLDELFLIAYDRYACDDSTKRQLEVCRVKIHNKLITDEPPADFDPPAVSVHDIVVARRRNAMVNKLRWGCVAVFGAVAVLKLGRWLFKKPGLASAPTNMFKPVAEYMPDAILSPRRAFLNLAVNFNKPYPMYPSIPNRSGFSLYSGRLLATFGMASAAATPFAPVIHKVSMIIGSLAVVCMMTSGFIVDYLTEAFEQRGALDRRRPVFQPLINSAVVELPNARPTSVDRTELQRLMVTVDPVPIMALKPANLYTWWHSIPPDMEDENGPLWVTPTGERYMAPSTYTQEFSNLWAVQGKLSKETLAIITARSTGYVAVLSVPQEVKSNTVAFGPLSSYWEAAPGLALKKRTTERSNNYPTLVLAATGLVAAGFVLGALPASAVGSWIATRPPQDVANMQALLFGALVSPFAEETLRAQFGMSFTVALCVYELVTTVLSGVSAAARIVPTLLHLYCQHLHSTGRPKQAFTLHFIYNLSVCGANVAAGIYPNPFEALAWCLQGSIGLWAGLAVYPLAAAPLMRPKPSGDHEVSRLFPACPYTESRKVPVQVQYGLNSTAYRPVAYANNAENFEAGLKQRVTYADITDNPIQLITGDYRDFWLGNNGANLRKLFDVGRIKAVPFSEYITRSNATPGVKRKISRAWVDLKQNGFSRFQPLPTSKVRSFCRLQCFVKVENLNYRTPYGVKDKAPRIIMGSDPSFLAIVGPWMMALSDRMKASLDGSKGFMFTSGATARQASDFLGCDTGYINEENDAAHWDRSVGRDMRETEYLIYKLFDPPTAVRQLLAFDAHQTRGVTASGVKFAMWGNKQIKLPAAQRPSGRPDTSLGNSATNAMIRAYYFCKHWGIELSVLFSIIKVLIQGDDAASRSPVGMPRINWNVCFADLGFELEYRLVKQPTDLTFCSMLNYPVVGGTCFGPKPGRIFGKTCWLIDPHPKTNFRVIARGVALGLLPAACFIEPLRMWVNRLLEMTEGVYARPVGAEEWQMSLSYAEPSPQTAAFLAARYGWGPTMRDGLAAELKTMSFGCGLAGPVYNHLIEVDTDGPVPNKYSAPDF